jgi:transposase
MLIIGCDFHPSFQQVAIFDNRTGEIKEKRLQHREESEQFYRSLAGQQVRVGMEACGHYPWFERLLAELGFELWLGDAAEIRARVVRKQKTDRRDAEHLLDLLRENRFPRIWVPSLEERDVRQLLVHRHKQVQARTRVKNQLQAMALSQGVQKKRKLWTEAGRAELEKLELLPYAAERRKQLLHSLDGLDAEIEQLNRRVEAEVAKRPAAVKLQTHPGVGPVTALAMVLTLGSRQLLRTDSQRVFQRRQAAAGTHQQTGQFVSALSAGGSGPDGGALRRRVGPFLSSPGGAQTSRPGQSGGGAQAGSEVVPDVARRLDLRATVQGGRAGEPESFRGGRTEPTG